MGTRTWTRRTTHSIEREIGHRHCKCCNPVRHQRHRRQGNIEAWHGSNSRTAGRWMKFRRRAHIVSSLISVHVGVGQRCRARDVESPTILPTMSARNVPAGHWRKCQRRFRVRALTADCEAKIMSARTRNQSVQKGDGTLHAHACGFDRRKTYATLPPQTTNSEHAIGAMERYTWVRFAGKLTPCHTHSHGNGQHTSGAMDELSGKVQNASTHPLQCQSHEHAHSSRSVQGPQFKGAMEESSWTVQKASSHRQPDWSTRCCWSTLPCRR